MKIGLAKVICRSRMPALGRVWLHEGRVRFFLGFSLTTGKSCARNAFWTRVTPEQPGAGCPVFETICTVSTQVLACGWHRRRLSLGDRNQKKDSGLDQRFTRGEVERMTGATRRQLDYWARLGLVHPRARWGERFFGFTDLVAVETIRRITERRVPAGRLRRAMDAFSRQLGETRASLASLRIVLDGNQIIVHEPGPQGRLVEPISGQFLLNFETAPLERKVRALGGRSAEQWFEMGMSWDSNPGTLPQAADAYRSALELSPDWVEAHINLGTALYQLGRMEESRDVFRRATILDPRNALGHFNLGCMHDRLGDALSAIEEFRAAIANSPHMADAHLNLALAYEKSQRLQESLQHLSHYLRYEPQGPWADFARMRLRESRGEDASKVTPFRKIRN